MPDAVARAIAGQVQLRFARIPIGKLRVHPRNITIRMTLGNLDELAQSLLEEGQHQAIEVQRKGDYFEILDGQRRFGAAVLARLKYLDAVIVPERDDREAMTGMLATGLHHRALTPAERQRAINTLMTEFKMSGTELAKRFGVHVQTIYNWRNWRPAGAAADEDPDPQHGPRPAPRPRHRQPRPPQIPKWKHSVAELHARYANKFSDEGLSLDEVGELLDALRELAGPAAAQNGADS